jgi:Ribbon-helix-helix protein, copG family
MSVNVSVRLDDDLAERLRLRARAAGESLSDRLRRYAEEGARRDEHPLITFRDGPTGRRAGLVGGPDVWEVAMWLDDLVDEADPVAVLVDDGVVSRPQIDAALRYRGVYPDEIAARIELHRRETAAADRR